MAGPREVLELKVRERPSSTLRNVDGGPLGGAEPKVVEGFPVWASKPVKIVFSSLASKLVAIVFSSLVSKLVAMVSPGLASKPAIDFLVEPQNQGGGWFPSLGLKTGSSGLVILVSKSPRRFLGLELKTK
jgi:hypothetical protein